MVTVNHALRSNVARSEEGVTAMLNSYRFHFNSDSQLTSKLAFVLSAALFGVLLTTSSLAATVRFLAQAPHVTIKATTATAFEDGSGDGVFVITRDAVTPQPLTVHLNISGTVLYRINDAALNVTNPATNGADFEHLSGQVIIPAGATVATITVRPLHDNE